MVMTVVVMVHLRTHTSITRLISGYDIATAIGTGQTPGAVAEVGCCDCGCGGFVTREGDEGAILSLLSLGGFVASIRGVLLLRDWLVSSIK
jgi:hypothetical protein